MKLILMDLLHMTAVNEGYVTLQGPFSPKLTYLQMLFIFKLIHTAWSVGQLKNK